jgi:sarcosine oxidase, subunit alpha
MTAPEGSERCDVLIVGAGPAGLAAAAEAARRGLSALVVDEGPLAGGRALAQAGDDGAGLPGGQEAVRALLDEATDAGVRIRTATSVWSLSPGWHALLAPVDPSGAHALWAVEAGAVVVAVGATELPVPLPGWTLPGVLSLGAAQRLLHVHGVAAGRRVAIVGTDALAQGFARDLTAAGARVVGLAAPSADGDLPAGVGAPSGPPVSGADRVALAIAGRAQVERLRVAVAGSGASAQAAAVEEWEVDAVVLSGGQAPLTDVAHLAGCPLAYVEALGGFVPVHGPSMETSVAGLFVAGSAAGVDGREVAAAQGRLAALASARFLGSVGGSAFDAACAAARAVVQASGKRSARLWPEAAAGRQRMAELWRRVAVTGAPGQ